ncbi:hypothetical protein [Cellulophaga sp. E6(2014)]|uniref:hypothetical protein n=1 Tax=Cellulophaga sp. E6(2014) TaxID=1495334 RepID=UPI00126A0F75|nr:hypothetical protein [Cellulophaga sp. E6(2014)]
MINMISLTYLKGQFPLLVENVLISPNFFIAILAGVVLALAFQFILTAISIAAGISAIGDVKKNFVKSRVEPSSSVDQEDNVFDQDYSSSIPTGVKITTAFGIWSVITTCIALFGATALAINLNVAESGIINTVTSLVIWALFFLLLFYLEAKAASTLIGSLINTATSGLRGSANMVASFLSPSPETKIENVVGNTVDRIRKEFDSGMNLDKVSDVLNNFLSRVDNKIPDYQDLKSDLEGIAKKSANSNNSGKWMAIQQILTKAISENSASNDSQKKSKAAKLKEILDSVVTKYNASSGKVEGIKNVIEEFTPLERKDIDNRIEQIKEFVRTSSKDNMSVENIESTFKKILDDPKIITSMIANNFQELNGEKLKGLLEENSTLNRDEIESYAEQLDSTLKKVVGFFDSANDESAVKRIETSLATFFENTGKSELDYSLLKNDLKRVLDDPKDSLEIIKKRFSTFDNETLRALVTNNRYIKEEHIDKVLETLESSKNEVMDKITSIQTKAHQQIEMTKRKAIVQAEHARATAASAAWWLVAASILSAIAAIGGGILAL